MRTTCPVVPPVCYAAKRNPWLAQNIHATNFFCSIELICLICWLKIVMIIHVSFCTTCRKFRMWVLSHKGASNLTEQKAVIRPVLRLLKGQKVIITGDREFHSIFLQYSLNNYSI